MRKFTVKYVVISLCAALLLSGCGIKPDKLDPPPGAENKEFPRTYPDLRTDPAPHAPYPN